MALRQNFAEGHTSGTTLTAANSGDGAGDTAFDTVTKTGTATAAFDNGAAAHGTTSYRVTVTTSTDSCVLIWSSGINSTGAAAKVYFQLNSLPSIACDIFTIRNSGAVAGKIQLTATNKLQIQNAAGGTIGTGTFPTALSAGVMYRLELECAPGGTTATGFLAGRYFIGDSNTPVDPAVSSSTTNTGTTNITNVRFGKITTASGTLDAWFDDFGLDDATTTPLGPSLQSGATLTSTTTITSAGVAGKNTGSSQSVAVGLTSAGVAGKNTGAAQSVAVGITAAGTVTPNAGASMSTAVTITAAGTAASTGSKTGDASISVGATITAAGSVSGAANTGDAALTTQVTITADGVVAGHAPGTLFTPPLRRQVVILEGRALRYSYDVCSTVWKQGGVWHAQEVPYDGDLAQAEIILTTSGPVIVTLDIAAELIAAGIGTIS